MAVEKRKWLFSTAFILFESIFLNQIPVNYRQWVQQTGLRNPRGTKSMCPG